MKVTKGEKTMRNIQEHICRLGHSGTFFAGALIVLGLSIVPISVEAGVLQDTFGKGYSFLDNQRPNQSIQTSSSIKIHEQGTFKPTFGEGYAFLEKDSLTPIVLTKDSVIRPGAKIFSGAPAQASRISAFHSLFGEGYGRVIQTR